MGLFLSLALLSLPIAFSFSLPFCFASEWQLVLIFIKFVERDVVFFDLQVTYKINQTYIQHSFT